MLNVDTVRTQVYEACPQLSGLVLLALSSAGRGGEGDMGQRIRDEILAIQQRNQCKVSLHPVVHVLLVQSAQP
jgi:alpha-glucan,water dikinase